MRWDATEGSSRGAERTAGEAFVRNVESVTTWKGGPRCDNFGRGFGQDFGTAILLGSKW